MCGKEQAAKVGTVPLSAKTVSKRLDVLAQNIKEQLIIFIKSRQFTIQLEETSDVPSDPQVIEYVRYRDECRIGEEMSFCSRWKLEIVA